MHLYDLLPLCVLLAAIFAYINHKVIRWPAAIGIMVLSLSCSVVMVMMRSLGFTWLNELAIRIGAVNFRDLLLNFMLSFLLFAGAIHLDAGKLRKERIPVTVLALAGTIISAATVGTICWFLFRWLGHPVPLIYCLIFGTIISPTDPVAVLSILREARIPTSLEYKISGESLFNDGIGVVLFVTMTELAHAGNFSLLGFTTLLLREAGGGLLFGALLGYAAHALLRTIDDYKIEILITLAVVTGGYWLADRLHISGPLAMVVAGLITGNKTRHESLSAETWDYMGKFWELIDELLNAILFMLVGLQMLVVKLDITILLLGLASIMVMLFSRWLSVALPVWALKSTVNFERNAIAILTWGGLKGGLSIALALSLPVDNYRDTFLTITYIIVVFSILVQGLSIGGFTRRMLETDNK